MPDSTNNHGGSWDLTIPAGDDTVDIVRDVGTLGVEVDVALSEAFVGMIDADAGDGDYSGATVPLSLYGTGRPDTENITAPTGSTYTCTNPENFTEGTGNFGAREWTKVDDGVAPADASGWVVTEGTAKNYVTNLCSTNWGTASGVVTLLRWGNQLNRLAFNGLRPNARSNPGDGLFAANTLAEDGWLQTSHATAPVRCFSVKPNRYAGFLDGPVVYWSETNVAYDYIYSAWTSFYEDIHPWPTSFAGGAASATYENLVGRVELVSEDFVGHFGHQVFIEIKDFMNDPARSAEEKAEMQGFLLPQLEALRSDNG